MNELVKSSETTQLRTYDASQLQLIRNTIASDCNNQEFDLFIEIAKRAGLDPFKKQIYAMVTSKNSKDQSKRKLVTMTGIDGYRSIALRCGNYRPDDEEPVFTYNESLKNFDSNPLGLERVKVTCYKMMSGVWHKIIGVAYWDEFAPLDWKSKKWNDKNERHDIDESQGQAIAKGKDNWRKMPRVMLSKCAEAQALRKGWSENIGGIYIQEEMENADFIESVASEIIEKEKEQNRLRILKPNNCTAIQWSNSTPIVNVQNGELVDLMAKNCVTFSTPDEVDNFISINSISLKSFWATNKSDCIEIRKILDMRKEELQTSEMSEK